ncbi:hypothetical protein A3759_03330 [Thalassolituus sp. HI0120]|nr:hypothetical protein A3759_03330 [Thalassolituus sp. HI0120]
MITLYQFEMSPFCDKVRRVLKYKGLSYETKNVSLQQVQFGFLKKLTPIGKLPVLTLNGRHISDSSTIITELENQYPEKPVLPTDKRQAALVHFFEEWADEGLYFNEVYLRFVLPSNAPEYAALAAKEDNALFAAIGKMVAPGMIAKQAKAQGIGRKPLSDVLTDLKKHFSHLSDWLEEQDYLVGDSLTLADISVASQLACIVATPEGGVVAADYPRVSQWLQRVEQLTV